jgi:hypothetical protein
MIDAADLRTRAGKLLYHELPEEYRFRDPRPVDGDLADLEAYLHGFGHLFDLIRGTTEQAYADGFAERADNDREIQSWLIPYLAELVGAELRSPDPKARRNELNQTVSWYKSKGSLRSIDEISDVVSSDETVVVEGWRRTLTTPRMTLPPFSTPKAAMGDSMPQGTPTGFKNRAVMDPNGSDPLYALRFPRRDEFGRLIEAEVVYWRPLARRGTPCVPGAYDDTALRTPDLRYPGERNSGPHPRRTLIHVRPPEGFFATGLKLSVTPTVADLPIKAAEPRRQSFGPSEILDALGLTEALKVDGNVVLPDRVLLTGNLTIPPGTDIEFQDLLFTGTIKLVDATARLTLRRCAVEKLKFSGPSEDPALDAADCLFNSLEAPLGGFAQLVQCTVLEQTNVERLHASDCIFAGEIIDLDCSGNQSCIRYSRVPDLSKLSGCGAEKSPSTTDHDPNFIQLWFEDGTDCILRPALFGEPGAGVLDLVSSSAVLRGAENDGEMGAYNHLFHAARLRALELKLEDHLPFGQEIAIQYDPCLSRRPPAAV